MERFLVNTTFCLRGFVDVASQWKIPDHGEDFGQTLAMWGVGEEPNIMLPFFGPSNPRDATGLVVDALGDPTNCVHLKQHLWWSAGREYFTALDLWAQTYQTIQDIQRNSVDYCASFGCLYRQLRRIFSGKAARTP